MSTNPQDTGHAAAKTILIIDDEVDNLALVAHYLSSKGYRTLTAGSAEQGLAVLDDEHPDLILLDVVMPGMDGFAMCRALKSDPARMFTPVILVTALAEKEDRIKGLKAGADEFLSKPVNREELITRVRSLIRWQDARNALERRKLAELRRTFGRYLSGKVIDAVLSHPDGPEGALRDQESRVGAVVLFADLRGFTAISERLAPAKVVGLLNEFFTVLTDVVHRYDGTIFNMAGDSLLVGFGVPFVQRDATERALRCAVEMQEAFIARTVNWRPTYGAAGGLGIGMSYGEVVVGNVGSPTFMSYTVIGSTVNMASRLTDHAGEGEILVTDRFQLNVDRMPAGVSLEPLEPVRLKGRTELQSLFKVTFGAARRDR